MDDFRLEILDDLSKILEKIIEREKTHGKEIFSDEFIIQLSYTMEKAAGVEGITNEEIVKYKPNYFRDINN